MSSEISTPSPANAQPSKSSAWIIPLLIVLIALLLLLLVTSRWNTWTGNAGDQKTNDAYVHANIVPLSTRISDTLRQLNVSDYEAVKAGQLIAQLDDTDYRAQLEQAESTLAASKAALDDNQVQKQVQKAKIAQAENELSEAVQSEHAAVGQVAQAEAVVQKSSRERSRQEALYAQGAATHQTLETAVANDESAKASLASAKANAAKAVAAIESARSVVTQNQRDLLVLNSKDNDLNAKIRESLASVKSAQVQVNYTQIHAPVDGLVTERKVFPGQLVSPGMEIISLVEGDLWVQANFEETQLAHMRVGDRADIRIDAVPGLVWRGRVSDIAPASGSQTAVIPADNATGNFTKVVQRLPVKIAFDREGRDDRGTLGQLRPGFSCEVVVSPSGLR